MTAKEFQSKIFEIMARRNLKIIDAARSVECSCTAVTRWLAGRSAPHHLIWQRILQDLEEYQSGR